MRNHDDAILREQVSRLGRPSEEMLDCEIGRLERREQYKRFVFGILAGLAAAVAAIIIATNLWVAVLQIDGSSMNPFLRMDEIVLAVRTDKPVKNDVIAFYVNNKIYIKRVIAAGGDAVDIKQDGTVSVNGTALDEPYITELCLDSCDIDFPFQVPTGTFFVLGDNRPASLDSRNSAFGTVSREQIIGRVIFRMWPLPRIGSIS